MGRLAEMQRKLLEVPLFICIICGVIPDKIQQQMMGPEAMGVANANLVWSDDKVCRNFLCGTCPHALFTNTMEYEANIFAFVDECDRRIRAAHRRLEKTPEENAKTTNLMREIAEIELAIQGGTEKIETLGEQGKVDESMREMAAIEALKSEKAEKERELQQLTDTSGASGHQKLRVCDVCGAYLSVLDSDRRLADHFGGKMHLGYHELRNMLSKFKEEREKRKMAPPSSLPSGAAAPSGGASRTGDHRSSRGGDDYRDRDRGYDRQPSRYTDTLEHTCRRNRSQRSSDELSVLFNPAVSQASQRRSGMDMLVQFEQEQSLAPMDTTPIPPPLPVDFIPTNLAAPLLPQQQQQIDFLSLDAAESDLSLDPPAPPIHLPMPDMSMSVFLNTPLDPMDAPAQLHTAPSSFMSDPRTVADPFALLPQTDKADFSPDARNLSVSPPQSQVPSPPIHGAPSSYGVAAPSSLESALDPAVSGRRSRANTSLSPPSLPSNFPSLSPPSLQNAADYPSSSSTANLEESVSQQQPQTVIGQMLKDIAKTAIDAGDAFENCHGVQQTTKVGELRDRIQQVLFMLQHMSFADPSGAPSAIHLLVTIHTLRCQINHGNGVHRTWRNIGRSKALKREPQEDAPLSLSINEAPLISAAAPAFAAAVPPASVGFPLMQSSYGSQSRPPSRPPSPPATFSARNSFSSMKPQTSASTTFSFPAPTSAPHLPGTLPLTGTPIQAGFPPLPHSSWSDPVIPSSSRHHHSLSAGSITAPIVGTSAAAAAAAVPPAVLPNALPQPLTVPSNAVVSTISPPIGRMSRSGSISGTNFKNPYASLAYPDSTGVWHTTKAAATPTRAAGQSNWYFGSDSSHSSKKRSSAIQGGSAPPTAHNSPSDDEDDDEESDSDESVVGKTTTHQPSGDRQSTSSSAAAEMPPEYRADVDRIFFMFLNKLCSNLDATDAKGEQIHQTLMAKKMQRLDESPDFRPFKFRILAFTNAFMEELGKQGYPEDKIPMKKVRNYLWRQQYILRFNEDGKKAKSKGNHIWNIEAKKSGDGQWDFRPFHRKLAGTPPGVAYCGLRWSWKPHVWDPQLSFKKVHVTYSSPTLPPWLSWRNGELSGIPPPDAESCQITVVAKFNVDNQDSQLSHTFALSIAPVAALDATGFSRSRRPSLVGEPPKRSTSDSALFQIPQRNSRNPRVDDTRVIRVLQSVAQRVTDEAESQFVSASPPKQGELQDLVKQKHVLEQTVDAYDKAISGQGHLQSRRLAVAAQHVVLQAAKTVIADRTIATGGIPTPQVETVAIQSVSVSELTDKTQDAIAMAVKMNGTASNEVDIIVTATSILKSQTPMLDNTPPVVAPPPVVPRVAAFPASNLTTLPEY
ncbi:hypothetical protein NLJ89_g4764 [Agrocybe chaxingu]|uniref:Uncharacterized protein n=1 Tax=Agrocybe chaxingu TaxID=84603 RepID=A0A9W8JZU2_9AGAR|nr:hypothetical protein NLJ89_g4764 [Agrocybe chaxingu]